MGNDQSKQQQQASGGGGTRAGGGGKSSKTATLSLPIHLGKSGPSAAELQRHLDTAKKTRVLQLRQTGMKTVPSQQIADAVGELLRTLDLSQNRLKQLPDVGFFPRFTMLKQLHLANNALTALPDELGGVKTLEVLNVANNQLVELPSTLVGCGQLKQLLAAENHISVFPLVLCEMRQELELVDLTGNLTEELPPEIDSLKVTELNLTRNRLHRLHPHLSRCTRLRTLRLDENCLAKEEFTPEILSDSNVSLFTYAGNLFQESDFQQLRGYDAYQQRYTATRIKRG